MRKWKQRCPPTYLPHECMKNKYLFLNFAFKSFHMPWIFSRRREVCRLMQSRVISEPSSGNSAKHYVLSLTMRVGRAPDHVKRRPCVLLSMHHWTPLRGVWSPRDKASSAAPTTVVLTGHSTFKAEVVGTKEQAWEGGGVCRGGGARLTQHTVRQ